MATDDNTDSSVTNPAAAFLADDSGHADIAINATGSAGAQTDGSSILLPEPAIDTDLLAFSQRVNASLQLNLPQPAQAELGELLDLLPNIDIDSEPQLFRNLQIAFTALLQRPPQITLAQKIIKDINTLLQPNHSVLGRPVPPATVVVFGLICLLVVGTPLLAVAQMVISSRYENFFGEPIILVLAVVLAGVLGSCVSIMIRINDFRNLARTDTMVLFFTGFFKPVIGLAFALFLFAIIKSGVIPIEIQAGAAGNPAASGLDAMNNSEAFFVLALAFVSGFSERFARDIASKVENTVGTG
jgi:hypothetical protein